MPDKAKINYGGRNVLVNFEAIVFTEGSIVTTNMLSIGNKEVSIK